MAKPNVLLVDDHIPPPAVVERLGASVELNVQLPQFVREEDLEKANLVLVDWRLDDWLERDALPTPSLRPRDGLALSSTLKSHLSSVTTAPVAFALWSAHLADLVVELPPVPHNIARQRGVEWAFSKTQDADEQANQVTSLALAVMALPRRWGVGAEFISLATSRLLGISTESWADRARIGVAGAFPPVHQSAIDTRGIAFLRWLLHRVLPYPGFLWSAPRIAVRLGVRLDSFTAAVQPARALGKEFQPYRYNGLLSSFLGPRWWRAGIEQHLWDATNGNSFDADMTAAWVRRKTRGQISQIEEMDPVLWVDDRLEFQDAPVSRLTAVRVQPDDWPSYAEPAWARQEDVERDAMLRALTVST